MTATSEDQKDATADVYARAVQSFATGMFRLWQAEAAHARLICALLEFRLSEAQGDDSGGGDLDNVLSQLRKVPHSSYKAYAYITNLSHLVYATSLLDTFLTDTTTFLLLLFPHALGSGSKVPIEQVLTAGSTHDLVTSAVGRKAREVSFLSFAARIDYLRQTFGLPIPLDTAVVDSLEHYSCVRNTAVHDQGFFRFELDAAGQVSAQPKACPLQPTVVEDQDIRRAIATFMKLAQVIATDVMSQCIGVVDHPSLSALGLPPESTKA